MLITIILVICDETDANYNFKNSNVSLLVEKTELGPWCAVLNGLFSNSFIYLYYLSITISMLFINIISQLENYYNLFGWVQILVSTPASTTRPMVLS